jgi:hypothetical protein
MNSALAMRVEMTESQRGFGNRELRKLVKLCWLCGPKRVGICGSLSHATGQWLFGTAKALGFRMNTTVNVNQSRIAKGVVLLLVLVALALATSFARAGEDRQSRAAVAHAVQVKTVAGVAEYAYDSTGWRPLSAGKILQAGASIRTGSGASVVLAMEEQGSLLRVGPMRRLELAAAAPTHETSVTIVPLQARVIKVKAEATELAAQ